nr:trk system potassium uptake protein [Salmonella sp. NCTC 7297]
MHFRAITRIVGLLVILFSGTMILPGLVALIYRDGAGRAFTQTFFVALAIGSMLWWPNRREKGRAEIPRRISYRGAVLDRAGQRGCAAVYFLRKPKPHHYRCFF